MPDDQKTEKYYAVDVMVRVHFQCCIEAPSLEAAEEAAFIMGEELHMGRMNVAGAEVMCVQLEGKHLPAGVSIDDVISGKVRLP